MAEAENMITRPGLLRHLAVIIYDLFLLFAVLLVATLFVVILNHGEAIKPGDPFYFAYLVMISFLFYGWFWTHGNRTIGMRSWQVCLVSENETLSWRQCLFRFFVAGLTYPLFGLGLWWQFFNSEKASLPDLASGTRLHYDAKAKKRSLSPLS